MRVPVSGELFADRYRVERTLGVGGFATVMLAMDEHVRRPVVLKLLSPDANGSYPTTVAARFEREARIFVELKEPTIVTMYDFGQSPDGLLYMVFEYVEGRDLRAVLDAERLPPPVVEHIVLQLLTALREAHAAGVLHRDLKPANVLIYTYGADRYRVKLIDFGIAKDVSPDATRLTKTGNVVGTLRYMSPEQVFGEPLSPATDIFCLGMVAWEMLMGRPLIDGTDRGTMLQQHAQLGQVGLEIDLEYGALRDALVRALQLDPNSRFGSADAMIASLRTPVEPSRDGQPRPRPIPEPTERPNATRWGLVALGVLLATIVLAFVVRDEPPEQPVLVQPRDISTLTEAPQKSAAEPRQEEPESADEPAETDEPLSGDKCERPPPFTGENRLENPVSGDFVTTYIPKTYDHENPPGLVLLVHRRLRTGMDMIRYTGIAEFADKHNWVVIAPNAPLPTDWPDDAEVGLRAIDLAVDKLCLDRTRLHILADEHGVKHARRVACAIPVSSVVGAFATRGFKQCEPEEPFPYMRLYTKQDRFHDKDGHGCGRTFFGASTSWDKIHRTVHDSMQCSDAAAEPWSPFEEDCTRSVSCAEPLVFCAFDGGHRWPLAHDLELVYQSCNDPATTAPMMEAAATFMTVHGRSLSEDQIASMDATLERLARKEP